MQPQSEAFDAIVVGSGISGGWGHAHAGSFMEASAAQRLSLAEALGREQHAEPAPYFRSLKELAPTHA